MRFMAWWNHWSNSFRNDESEIVTINEGRYRSMITDFFVPQMNVINGHVNWPTRSHDLTPLDYFLWEYVKPLIYANELQTVDDLEANTQMLQKVVDNWSSTPRYVRAMSIHFKFLTSKKMHLLE